MGVKALKRFKNHNIYDNYRLQLKRKKDLDKIYKLINIEINNKEEFVSAKALELEIQKINDRITFLEDLIPRNSNFKNDLDSFKNYFYSLIAYDDKDEYYVELENKQQLEVTILYIKSSSKNNSWK